MDRLDAMQAFVRVVEVGNFSAVARELKVEQSTVSKWVAALEEELGSQLIQRTTRRQQVTDAGWLFYDHARGMLASYADVTAQLGAGGDLRGRLRVGLPVVFGERYVTPHLARFARQHPKLEIELLLDDRYVDLVRENLDVSVRVGTPVDSSVRARTLARSRRRLVASPGYLKRRGRPQNPKALADHECLLHTGLKS